MVLILVCLMHVYKAYSLPSKIQSSIFSQCIGHHYQLECCFHDSLSAGEERMPSRGLPLLALRAAIGMGSLFKNDKAHDAVAFLLFLSRLFLYHAFTELMSRWRWKSSPY